MAAAETARLVAELSLKDKLTGQVNKAIGSVDRLDKKTSGIGKNINRSLSNAGRNIEHFAAIGLTAAVGGFIATAKAAGDFGEQMNIINTIAQKTPAELADIGGGIRALARDTGAGLDDLTGAYYDLLSAGIKVGDAQNALAVSYRLSRGALSTTTEAVDFLTTAINTYGLSQAQTIQVADQFAQAVADGKVKLSDISETFARIAPLAKTFGIGVNEIAAAYGFLTAKGVTAEAVTTQMARAIQDIVKPTGKAADKVKTLEDTFHVSFAKIAKEKGLVPALEKMRELADKAHIKFQDLFGRKEGLLFALQTTGPEFAKFEAEQQRINESTGALSKQFDERQKGLNYQFGRLKANVQDAAISIGEGFAPSLGKVADKLTTFIGEHRADFVGFGKDLGAAIDSIDWDKAEQLAGQIGDALKIAGAGAKAVLSAFLGMPSWIQGAVLTGWGLNKLTGGGLGAIVGELGKGLIHGVLGMNAGVVNINAGVVNGAGGVGGAPAGAGGAAGGTGVLGILGAAGAAAAGAAILGAIQSGAQQVFAGISPSQAATNAFNQSSGIPKGQFALLDNLANLPKLLGAVQHGNVLEGGLIDQLTHKDAPAQTKSLGTIVGGSVARAVASAFEKAKQTALSAAIDKDIHRLETLTSRLHQAKESGDSGRTASLREKIGRVSERVDSEKQALTSSVVAARDATVRSGVTTSSAATAAGRVVAAAVEANRPYMSTIVKVNVSAAGVSRSITVQNRSGPGNGSAGGGSASDRNGTTPNKPGSGARGG